MFDAARPRTATPRRYLMCPPTHFAVTYAINPWMDPSVPVDAELAMRQWTTLRDTYRALGHRVELIEPIAGLPDMVFAANGGLVVDGRALGARFHGPERAPEADAYVAWLASHVDARAHRPVRVMEAEGDLLAIGEVVLAGHGFRTERAAHEEVAEVLDREVVSLQLVDPRYYHLDTCLAVLDDTTIAWLPAAFAPPAQAELRRRFPDGIEASAADAAALGLNAVSDGRHVVLAAEATALADALEVRGFTPVPVELSELRKAGGGPKCCTMELRAAASDTSVPGDIPDTEEQAA